MKSLISLKLGGSVITDKDSYLKADIPTIRRLAAEIARSQPQRLLIVHGAGSFGHPLAKKYGIIDGFKIERQLLGFCKIRMAMIELNRLVVDALLEEEVPAVPVFPCSYVTTRNGRIETIDLTPILGLLGLGFVPVTCGDVVYDSDIGFTVLSGDQLISHLSIVLNASRIVLGVDVDGIFSSNPKTNPDAKLLDHLSLVEVKNLISSLGKSTSTDVTGGMFGKINELITAVENGIEVIVMNASKPGRMQEVLGGRNFVGTKIVVGE
jgi:isopentenyl phosphate kinase